MLNESSVVHSTHLLVDGIQQLLKSFFSRKGGKYEKNFMGKFRL
jgi:hypothetical protein